MSDPGRPATQAGSKVVAVVVTYNRPALLKLSLDALRSQTIRPHNIVVVDNASDDQTVALLRGDHSLTVIRMPHNTGGSGGFAAGVERAMQMNPDWVWLLDDDVIVQPTALEQLLHAPTIDVNAADLAALCPAVEEDGKLALMHRRHFNPRTLIERGVSVPQYRLPAVEIDIGSFVGFLVRSGAILRAGLPDSRFFLAYDDTEFSLRLKQAGFKLWLIPGSLVDHRRRLDARLRHGPFSLKHYYNLRNRHIVYRKFGGNASLWRWWFPIAQGFLLTLVAGKGRPAAFRWWLKSLRDGRGEPYVLRTDTNDRMDNTLKAASCANSRDTSP